MNYLCVRFIKSIYYSRDTASVWQKTKKDAAGDLQNLRIVRKTPHPEKRKVLSPENLLPNRASENQKNQTSQPSKSHLERKRVTENPKVTERDRISRLVRNVHLAVKVTLKGLSEITGKKGLERKEVLGSPLVIKETQTSLTEKEKSLIDPMVSEGAQESPSEIRRILINHLVRKSLLGEAMTIGEETTGPTVREEIRKGHLAKGGLKVSRMEIGVRLKGQPGIAGVLINLQEGVFPEREEIQEDHASVQKEVIAVNLDGMMNAKMSSVKPEDFRVAQSPLAEPPKIGKKSRVSGNFRNPAKDQRITKGR